MVDLYIHRHMRNALLLPETHSYILIIQFFVSSLSIKKKKKEREVVKIIGRNQNEISSRVNDLLISHCCIFIVHQTTNI